MIPKLLETLEFRSNNETHAPGARAALELLQKHADSKVRVYPLEEDVPRGRRGEKTLARTWFSRADAAGLRARRAHQLRALPLANFARKAAV